MYVELHDLIRDMMVCENCCFDLYTYNVVYSDCDPNFSDRYIPLPEIDRSIIREAFAGEYSSAKGGYKLKEACKSEDEFYRALNKFFLRDEWEVFEYRFLADRAKDWCEQNNINHTEKQSEKDISMTDVIDEMKSMLKKAKQP